MDHYGACARSVSFWAGLIRMAITSSGVNAAQLTQLPAWRALTEHSEQVKDPHLRELFAADPGRGERMTADAPGLYLAYSKPRITAYTLRLLVRPAPAPALLPRF